MGKQGQAAPPEVLKLAGHAVRWRLLTNLAHSDYRVQELVEQLQLPQNLVSYHLRQLRDGKLVLEHRSTADERAVYYSLNTVQFQQDFLAAGALLHPALLAQPPVELLPHHGTTTPTSLRVLFLCTENSARSQMAEALLRQLSKGRIEAVSAGNQPAPQIHALARQRMEERGIDMSNAVPRHFALFQDQHFDAIVTVCDRAREACPPWSGATEHIHWSLADPARAEGSEAEKYQAFAQTAQQLETRISLLITRLECKRQKD